MLHQAAGKMSEPSVAADALDEIKDSQRLRLGNCFDNGEIEIERNNLAPVSKTFQRRGNPLSALDGIQLVRAEVGASVQDRDVVCH